MAIVVILSVLAGIVACTLMLNPGKYGVTPAEQERNAVWE